jgi:seryl-tRNA synthetase
MLDIRYIREHPDKVQQNTERKGYRSLSVKELLELDKEKRELQGQVDELREQRNVNAAKMTGGKPAQDVIDEGKRIKIQLAEREGYLATTEEKFAALLRKFPNMVMDDVPPQATGPGSPLYH